MCWFVDYCIHTPTSASKTTTDRMRKKELCRSVAIETSLVCFDWQMSMPMPNAAKGPAGKSSFVDRRYIFNKKNKISNLSKYKKIYRTIL